MTPRLTGELYFKASRWWTARWRWLSSAEPPAVRFLAHRASHNRSNCYGSHAIRRHRNRIDIDA
ncbi:MAG: hypothetical protein ACLPQI_12465 [Steroidobacteraceae bacterium]